MKRKYLIMGRVQGVGFRYFINRLFSSKTLCGWVKNLSDGSVEIVTKISAEDEEDIINEMKLKSPGLIKEIKIEDFYNILPESFIIKY